MQTLISDQQWQEFEQNGFLLLGQTLDNDELSALQARIDDIMLGRAQVDYNRMLMQLDQSAAPAMPVKGSTQSKGFKGATLDYRKIQELEFDPFFLAYLQKPVFREICARAYGPDAPVNAFRAMLMNKPARKGNFLGWHQDRWNYLDRDPQITVWTALDPATIANGCVQIVPQSQRLGLVNPSNLSGFLTPEQAEQHATKENIEFVELPAGHAILLHNWLLHASDINRSDVSRRAFSVCYMDGDTQSNNGETYSRIFGEGALSPADLKVGAA